MRKILCFSAFMLATPVASFAQIALPPARATAVVYEHCMLVVQGYEYGDARLEYGQNFEGGSKDQAMKRTDLTVRKLWSGVAALNYLSSQGWECVGVSTVSTSATDRTGYLMRRAK
jgi:hypothetical protein